MLLSSLGLGRYQTKMLCLQGEAVSPSSAVDIITKLGMIQTLYLIRFLEEKLEAELFSLPSLKGTKDITLVSKNG